MAGCRWESDPPRPTAYDRFAWVYDRYWAGDFAARVLPVLDGLLLASLPAGARVLDLCCGTGQLARALTARGFAVTGVDVSEEMLRLARRSAPAAELLAADARTFTLPAVCDAVVCVFDSLNHVMPIEELHAPRPEDAVGETDVTIFRLEGEWRRDDIRLTQRCYSEEQVPDGSGGRRLARRHGARRPA